MNIREYLSIKIYADNFNTLLPWKQKIIEELIQNNWYSKPVYTNTNKTENDFAMKYYATNYNDLCEKRKEIIRFLKSIDGC